MFGLSKVFGRGIPIGLTLVALALAGGITNLQATPACTGTPFTGPTVLPITFLGTGACVEVQDKLFGNFNFGNLPTTSVVSFGFITAAGQKLNSMTILNQFTPGSIYTYGFDVEALGGAFITQMNADFTQTVGGTTTLSQTTMPTPNMGSINLNKTADVASGPFQVFFTPAQDVTDMVVNSTFTTASVSDASSILNTIFEPLQVTPTPEPAALMLLGIALAGLGLFGLRRKS